MNAILRGLLTRQLEKRSRTPTSVSKALDKNPSWLYRILSGDRRITVDSLETVLLEIGVGLDEFFAEYLQEVCSPHQVTRSGYSEDPQLILRALRGRNAPDLDWIGEFSNDRVTPLQLGQSFSVHSTVQRLDDAREFDRHAALVDAEAWLKSLQRRTQYRRLSAEETSQLCTALGVWSSIQRALGHQARGAKALELAWRLHGDAPTAPSCGDLLERTSMAVYEYGFPSLAIPFMQRAFAISGQWEDQKREVKTLLGIAILAFRTGEYRLATKVCSRLLQHPSTDTIRAAGATSFLVLAYEQQGDLESAVECLRKAEFAESPTLPPLAAISFLGLKARILKRLGDFEAARDLYVRILERSRPHSSPRYRGFILLHLAEVLVETDDASAIFDFSKDVECLVTELEDTPPAREIMAGLLIAIQRSELPAAETLRTMQSQMEELV